MGIDIIFFDLAQNGRNQEYLSYLGKLIQNTSIVYLLVLKLEYSIV